MWVYTWHTTAWRGWQAQSWRAAAAVAADAIVCGHEYVRACVGIYVAHV